MESSHARPLCGDRAAVPLRGASETTRKNLGWIAFPNSFPPILTGRTAHLVGCGRTLSGTARGMTCATGHGSSARIRAGGALLAAG